MLSEIKKKTWLGALGTIKSDFSWSFVRSLQEQEAPELLVPVRSEGKPPGWHLKVSTSHKKSLNLQPYLGRSPSVSSEVDILLCWETRLSALHGSLQSKLFTRSLDGSGPQLSGATQKKPKRNPGRTFRPSCSSSAQFELRVFLLLLQTSLMSLGVFFLILNYAFQETELSCLQAALLRAQRPLLSAARNRPRRLPKLGSGGHSGAVKWN